jgi:serine/threonine protein kinase
MILCPACSREVPAGQFCAACGARLPGSSEIPTRLGSRASAPVSGPDHGRFLPGAVLGSRYRIVALLGRGGMGEVYRADDLKLGQQVALKFLPEGIDREEARLARFMIEARIARQIAHGNVCRVYDVGEVDGHHFLSMEFVNG